MDRHRVIMQAQVASHLAGSRAYPARELREGIGQTEPAGRIVETAPEQQVVDLGDEVVQGTACLLL